MRTNPNFGKLYGNRSRRTLQRKDSGSVDWPEKDWFPSVGSCELLINSIKRPEIFGGFCNALRKFFGEGLAKKIYLVQEEATSDEIPQTLEFDITSLFEIEKSGLFRSSYNSVLCDEDFTFALKLHYERFGFLSGPDELCKALHASRVVAPFLEDVEWKN
jgi:hypothetical protein